MANQADFGKLVKAFKKLENEMKKAGEHEASGFVGFSAEYAVFVHENLEAYHKNGEAKYLENAYRESLKDIQAVIADRARKTRSLIAGIKAGCLLLQRNAQKRTPVKTGHLQGSAYSRVMDGDGNIVWTNEG